MEEIGQVAQDLRVALRRLGKAVVVITTRYGDERLAMAATAVSELSMDPPSMLICVQKSASISQALSHGADFCISILHESQEPIARMCSGPIKGERRFDMGSWNTGKLDLPYLSGAQANILCRNVMKTEYGTHAVYIGRVLQAISDDVVSPLMYLDGNYCSI